MKKQELYKQEREAFLKYYYYEEEGKILFARYWLKKSKKIANTRKLAAALIKRQLKANGITKLNSIKI